MAATATFQIERRPDGTNFAPGMWAIRTRDGLGFLSYYPTEAEAVKARRALLRRIAKAA